MSATPENNARQSVSFDIEDLKVQQGRLRHHARLHWAHWLILVLSMLVTILAWQSSSSALEKRDQIRFNHEAERTINQVRERLSHYEDALLAGVATMQSHDGDMSRDQWRRYSQHLKLNERYPGINGIGVIDYVEKADIPAYLSRIRDQAPDFSVFPEHENDLSLPIRFVEPEHANRSAIGLDVAFETNRREAAVDARLSGETRISGPITLVQDANQTPGFLFYAPYYDRRVQLALASGNDYRQHSFRGFIYAPLVVRDLIQGALGELDQLVSISLHDGEQRLYDGTPSNPLSTDSAGKDTDTDTGTDTDTDTDTDTETVAQHVPLFSQSSDILMHGRVWTYHISSTPAFENPSLIDQPTLVLLSGLCLEIMLLGLFWIMTRANRRILSLAEDMTANLSTQAQQLNVNNKDLESFAHIVSHDLKTPLRNIHSLTEILEEDLDSFLASNDPRGGIKPCLDGLRDQVTRSQNLISGILEYSIEKDSNSPTSSVDVKQLLTRISRQLDLGRGQLKIEGELPVLQTRQIRLEQVFTNLVQNAIKYNPDRAGAIVTIKAVNLGNGYQFSVADNGPGIESRYHSLIFEPFKTLESITDIHSSGIGLSIVQRAVERQGGTVTIDSRTIADDAGPTGTRFIFTWPDETFRATENTEIRHA